MTEFKETQQPSTGAKTSEGQGLILSLFIVKSIMLKEVLVFIFNPRLVYNVKEVAK